MSRLESEPPPLRPNRYGTPDDEEQENSVVVPVDFDDEVVVEDENSTRRLSYNLDNHTYEVIDEKGPSHYDPYLEYLNAVAQKTVPIREDGPEGPRRKRTKKQSPFHLIAPSIYSREEEPFFGRVQSFCIKYVCLVVLFFLLLAVAFYWVQELYADTSSSVIIDNDIPTISPTTTAPQVTFSPTNQPTDFPTSEPTEYPTAFPTRSPTTTPSARPTSSPTIPATGVPTLANPCELAPSSEHKICITPTLLVKCTDIEDGVVTEDDITDCALKSDDRNYCRCPVGVPFLKTNGCSLLSNVGDCS